MYKILQTFTMPKVEKNGILFNGNFCNLCGVITNKLSGKIAETWTDLS